MDRDPEGWVSVASGGSCRLGGCIHAAFRATLDDGESLFLKTNTAEGAWQFDAEQDGLAALNTHAPDVRASGVEGERAYLALDWLALTHQWGLVRTWQGFGRAPPPG